MSFIAGFSSRGPNTPLLDIIKPDVTAPGVDILAAWRDAAQPPTPGGGSEEFNVISGTSMSSPHDAGAAALVRGLPNTAISDAANNATALMLAMLLASLAGLGISHRRRSQSG